MNDTNGADKRARPPGAIEIPAIGAAAAGAVASPVQSVVATPPAGRRRGAWWPWALLAGMVVLIGLLFVLIRPGRGCDRACG